MRPTPHGPLHKGFHTHTISLLWIMSIFRGDSWRGQLPSAPFSLPPHHHSQREERAGCQPDRTASQHPGVSTSSLVLQAPPPGDEGGKESRIKIHTAYSERRRKGEMRRVSHRTHFLNERQLPELSWQPNIKPSTESLCSWIKRWHFGSLVVFRFKAQNKRRYFS